MSAEPIDETPIHPPLPRRFNEWRSYLDREEITPVIAIAGSRGKTSVLRAVESVFRAGGLRFASWTNAGVEIEGERQRGELGPWSRALTRLSAGGLDVAVQELDWATLQTFGYPDRIYPIVAITNLCANNDSCLLTPETVLARKSLTLLRNSVASKGRLILNADDFDVSHQTGDEAANRYLIGMSQDAPVLRRHLESGGDAAWVADAMIVTHEAHATTKVIEPSQLLWTHRGGIPFAVQNALMATAIARSCGLPPRLIASALATHDARPESMPGSFNVFDVGSCTAVVDQPMAPWFLRIALRAAANLGSGRQVRVVGPMAEVATSDLLEVGRLLGRSGGVLIAHGSWEPERSALLRQGAAGNGVPPIVVQVSDERSAVQQGLGMLRADDVLFVLAEDAPSVVRLLSRRLVRRANPSPTTYGAA